MKLRAAIHEFDDKCPISERTIIRHGYEWLGHKFVNDMGHPCEYRIIDPNGEDIGMIKYYRGRRLASYEWDKTKAQD